MNDLRPVAVTPVEGSLRERPWRHFILDDFLEDEEFSRLAAAAARPSREFEIEPGDEHRVEFSLLEDVALSKRFISVDFAKLLHRLTGEWCYLGEGCAQVRRATVDTPQFPVHIDSGGPRSFVAIHYVSPDWLPTNGGGLRLHATESGPVETTVDPIPNRLVVFEAAHEHWHSVGKTLTGARYSILSEWFVLEP